ncbi:40S ribosomal protein s10 [Plakobranchus ocellatus]|uniref:40S ribosomal protein s10 n=1 Tax=Plakobranchus ocellatus TaxID=259542 RepID=A0AAV4AH57_9GAST|nr:40S ribosomal protein s10 [Plakobranchus ocellatus]
MLIPKKERVVIYEYLFKEGVIVSIAGSAQVKHTAIDVPNLQVITAMKSLKSKGYVREQFAWKHQYWYLTNEGIQYLRDYLHLPAEIVPATLKKQTRPEAPKPSYKRPEGISRGGGGASDRQEYRKAGPPGTDKKSEVGPGSQDLEFRGGYGRGRGGFGGSSSAQ